MDRRTFLTAALGTAVASIDLSRRARAADLAVRWARAREPAVSTSSILTSSILDQPAADCPIDTVVIVMMENRSFDHYLGWLADDESYLEAGSRRFGATFRLNGRVRERYRDPNGTMVATRGAGTFEREKVETRGCTFRDPGHGWYASRVQRDQGFLARGTGNDVFALTYYTPATFRSTRRSPGGSRSSTTGTRRCWARRSRTVSTCSPRSRKEGRATRRG